MAEVPTFQPQGPRATNFANLERGFGDFSGFRAAADAMKTQADFFTRQSQILGQQNDARVQSEAFTAGLEAGFQTGFDINGLPQEGTIAAKAYNEGAIQSFTSQTEISLSSQLAGLEVKFAENPSEYEKAAIEVVSEHTADMPAAVAIPLQIKGTQQASSAHIRLQKSMLARQRAVQKQGISDHVALLTERREAIGIPDSEEELKEISQIRTDMERVLAQGVTSLHISGAKKDLEMLKFMGMEQSVSAREWVADQADPVEAGILLAQGETGNPELDNLPLSTRVEGLTLANQIGSAIAQQDAKRDREIEDLRQQSRDNTERMLRDTINKARTAEGLTPVEVRQAERMLDRYIDTAEGREIEDAFKLRDDFSNTQTGFASEDDAGTLAEIRARRVKGEITRQDIVKAQDDGLLTPETAQAEIDALALDINQLKNTATFRAFKSEMDLNLPSISGDPFEMIMMGFTGEEEDQTSVLNRERKDAIYAEIDRAIADGEITTEAQLRAFSDARLKDTLGIVNQEPKFRNLTFKDRAVIREVDGKPDVSKAFKAGVQQFEQIRSAAPDTTPDQAIADIIRANPGLTEHQQFLLLRRLQIEFGELNDNR